MYIQVRNTQKYRIFHSCILVNTQAEWVANW